MLWLNALEIAQKQRGKQEGSNENLLCQKEMIPGMEQHSWLVWSRTGRKVRHRAHMGRGLYFSLEHHVPRPLLPQTNNSLLSSNRDAGILLFAFSPLFFCSNTCGFVFFFPPFKQIRNSFQNTQCHRRGDGAVTRCDHIMGSPSTHYARWC